jgi:hypothetical protein
MQRQWVWRAVGALGLCVTACRGAGDADDLAPALDAALGSASLDAARVGVRVPDRGARDAADDATQPLTLPSAPEAACATMPLPYPPTACDERDRDATEPSSHRLPAQLTVAPSCALISARAADKDQDAYRFTSLRSDPVSIELSYTSESRSDLALQIFDEVERNIARADQPREGASERIYKIQHARAGGRYDVRVEGALVGLCQPYNLRVNTLFCTDSFEDNDREDSATMLTWNDDQTIELQATAHESEADFFDYVAPRADPVRITGTATASTDDSIVLRRVIGPVTGAPAIDAQDARSGPTTTFQHWVRSAAPGTRFRIQIAPSGTGCATYALKLEAAACSDRFEDNDSMAAAAPLSPSQWVEASAYYADDDFYDLEELARGGSCTLRYAEASESAQRLRVDVLSATEGSVASAAGRNDAAPEQTLRVSWSSPGATTLRVRAEHDGVCQPYTLRCDAPELAQ